MANNSHAGNGNNGNAGNTAPQQKPNGQELGSVKNANLANAGNPSPV